MTAASDWDLGLAEWHQSLPTQKGLEISFNLYSFGGSMLGADGTLLFLSDGEGAEREPGADGGNLGYLGDRHMTKAYLGVGFDEFGNFSTALRGGPGFVPETVALGGAAATHHQYLGGVTDGSGQPASLPFDLDRNGGTAAFGQRGDGLGVDISLSAAGLLEVAFDIHDGNGFVTYISQNVVGVRGQPQVPATVFVGFVGSTGGLCNRHQINDLTISTLN